MTRNSGEAPNGPNREGMTKFRSPKGPWRCRVCEYWPNLDSQSRFCVNCGRDYFGNPGTIPTGITRDGT